MKKLLLFLCMIAVSLPGFTQEILQPETENDTTTGVYTAVETAPQFPGGENARIKFLQDNIHYPDLARENKIQGTVFATFVVEKNGKISNVRIIRGIGGGCDEETVRVIKLMPAWSPGKVNNIIVRTQYNMPIKYTLYEDEPEVVHSEKMKKKQKKFIFF